LTTMNFIELQNLYRDKKSAIYSFLVKSSFGGFGKGSRIRPPFISWDVRDVYIGSNCCIAENGWIQGIRDYAGAKFTPRLEIGDGTYIGRISHIIACLDMKIGRNVVMADGVYITDNFHGFEDIKLPILQQGLRTPGPVVVEDEVWLGERVSVMPNVTIGRHSVVGSHSVVTKSIPPFCVAIGAPARVIKRWNPTTEKWEKESV
jgi:acetyltransferase-like isoleucine patch superfamily enzyme